MRPVWAAGGSHLLLLPIIITSNLETIILLPPCNLRPVWAAGGSHLLLLSIIIISNLETIILLPPCNMRPVWAAGGSHLLLLSIIIISNQQIIIFPAPWQFEACLGDTGVSPPSSIYYNHLQSRTHYIPCPLAIWGLSWLYGGFTLFVAKKSSSFSIMDPHFICGSPICSSLFIGSPFFGSPFYRLTDWARRTRNENKYE